MSKGFEYGTEFISKLGAIAVLVKGHGPAVRITLDDETTFICGEEQDLWSNEGWVRAKDAYGTRLGGIKVSGVEHCGERDLYDISLDNDEHTYYIVCNNHVLMVHNVNVIGALPAQVISYSMYKYIPYQTTTYVRTAKVVKKKNYVNNAESANIIQLGGVFEKIGEDDESIGGGDQKMGSSN